jgi:ADP-heptose:LPS heptosyltransferase
MYRDNTELLTHEVHNFVLNHGALGDVITSLPAVIHARLSHNSRLKLKVWCPPWQMELIDHLLKPYGEFEIHDFNTFPLKKAKREDWDGGPTSLNQMLHNTHTRNRVHMVDYAFGCLIDARPEGMSQRSYPTLAPLGPKTIELYDGAAGYVVFPIGATSDNKLFKAAVMAPVMDWCHEQGYTIVVVGTKTSHTMVEVGNKALEPVVLRDEFDKLPALTDVPIVDLREKTTLLELRDVLGHATAVVGVDGGTLHLAGTTDTNILFASGTTLPKHRYIARLGDPSHKIRYVGPRDLECAGCQSNWTMTAIDFRFCAYQDNLCMSLLHHDDFIAGLKELGL